jgi:predicted DNA-binding transcriptional regulator YafY
MQDVRRAMALLSGLGKGGSRRIDEVASELGIDPDEVERLVGVLMMCGVPPYSPDVMVDIDVDADTVAIRPGPADVLRDPACLTMAEAQALHAALAVLGGQLGPAEQAALASLLDKVESAIGLASDPAQVERLVRCLPGPEDPDVLAALRHAVVERRRVRIEHQSASRGRQTVRAVDPYRILDYGGVWYLLGMDHRSGEQRFFRVDRITRVEPTDEGFEPPLGEQVLGELPVAYAEPHTAEHARVAFAGGAARWARESWADHIDEASSSAETTVAVIPYLKESWIIGELVPFVGAVSVLEPRALAESFREVIEEMAERYSGPPRD